MKIYLQVPAPFPSLLRQDAPPEILVDYTPVVEKRSGGFGDINWVEVTVSTVAGYALPKVLDYIASRLRKIPVKIQTDHGFEEFTPEVVERLLRSRKSDTGESK